MRLSRRALRVLLIVLLCAALTAFASYLKDRNGVTIKCAADYPVNAALTAYRQDDPAWAKAHLGESKYTMKSSGCIVSCIASALSTSPLAADPGETNRLLGENDVFDASGNLQWDRLDAIEGIDVRVFDTPSAQDIDACLAAGRYPIVKIHRPMLFSYHHYVLIVGAENGEYICMDPLQNSLTKLSEYKNRVYALRCVYASEE